MLVFKYLRTPGGLHPQEIQGYVVYYNCLSTCTRSFMNTTVWNHQWRNVVRHIGIIPITQCCPSVMGPHNLTSHRHTHLEYLMRHIAIKTVSSGRSWGRVAYLRYPQFTLDNSKDLGRLFICRALYTDNRYKNMHQTFWNFKCICVLVFTVFLYCFFYVYLFSFVTSVRITSTAWKLKCICVLVFIVFLYCLFCVYLFSFVTSVRITSTEWKLKCRY
jgi:hypothetical protein